MISRTARDDLLQIWEHVAADNISAADSVLRRIDRAMATLVEFPNAFRFDERLGARLLVISPYIVAYDVADDSVQVLRVVDGRRDLEVIFRKP